MQPELPDASLPPATKPITAREWSLTSVVEVGREILAKRRSKSSPGPGEKSITYLRSLCRDLLDHRGEASGLALASEITERYQALPESVRLEFFKSLADDFDVNPTQVLEAAEAYRDAPDQERLAAIARSVEAPRQKLFRRINMCMDGTRTLVAMRGHLLPLLRDNPDLRGVDSDLKHLFVSWFNKGFLELRRIDWSSPAKVLEKVIDYEAVHEIKGWEDLRSRLADDRLCFAFFHPALADDPLVFVEIALTSDVPDSIAPLLELQREAQEPKQATTVVFYSISNCHPGLAGVSFGNFLIKNVVDELKREKPSLKTFVTLSPVPGFRKWLVDADLSGLVAPELVDAVKKPMGRVVAKEVHDALVSLCAYYLLKVKSGELPKDPVARFHLGNGARLHRLNPAADLSEKGREQSAGIMVNYLYDLNKIEVNHEAYFDKGTIAVSRAVSRYLP